MLRLTRTLNVRMARLLLNGLLLSDSDLEAFCLDYFKDVYRRFGTGMERTVKENLLLARIPPDLIINTLHHANPSKFLGYIAALLNDRSLTHIHGPLAEVALDAQASVRRPALSEKRDQAESQRLGQEGSPRFSHRTLQLSARILAGMYVAVICLNLLRSSFTRELPEQIKTPSDLAKTANVTSSIPAIDGNGTRNSHDIVHPERLFLDLATKSNSANGSRILIQKARVKRPKRDVQYVQDEQGHEATGIFIR